MVNGRVRVPKPAPARLYDGRAASMSGEAAAEPEEGTAYAYRPSLLGVPMAFQLTPGGINWSGARGSGHVPFQDVRYVRMAFVPATMQPHRFVTEIWADRTPKLSIISCSWKSMVEQERLDHAYRAFITELHRRLALAGSTARFEQGKHPLLYWPALAIFVSFLVVLTSLVPRAIAAGEGGVAALIGGSILLFGWYGREFFGRNRPRRYAANAPPRALLPKG